VTGIIVTVVSCIVAIVGFVHSHAAPEGNKGTFGLSRLGVALILLSAVGGVVGIMKAVSDAKEAANEREWRQKTTSMLQVVYVQLTGLQAHADPAFRKQLAQATDQISAIATMSRGSDFSMSDFTGTEFRDGKFIGADFQQALFQGASFYGARFEGADFRGADQDCPCSGERVSTLLRDSLGHTPPPLIVPLKPGFRVLASPRMVRPLGGC
jgi:hypothetical protein